MDESKNEKPRKGLWNDIVFIDRTKELHSLAENFSRLVNEMAIEKPLNVRSDLFESFASEEETEEEEPEEKIEGETKFRERVLLLIYEIDQMKNHTFQALASFRRKKCASNTKLRDLKASVQQLYHFLERLRIRAENLLCD